jgi:hypothetical protein
LFVEKPRLQSAGFGWAPSTFLGQGQALSAAGDQDLELCPEEGYLVCKDCIVFDSVFEVKDNTNPGRYEFGSVVGLSDIDDVLCRRSGDLESAYLWPFFSF